MGDAGNAVGTGIGTTMAIITAPMTLAYDAASGKSLGSTGESMIDTTGDLFSGKMLTDFMEGPDIPEPATPEPDIVAGDEGIRRGEMDRLSRRKKAMGQAYLTKGQERGTGATLGGMANTLG